MMYSSCMIFVMFIVLNYISEATRVVLEANPKVIYPVITKKLQLRCSVKKNTWLPASIENSTTDDQGSRRVISDSGEFQHLMSIVITEGNRETIASVTGCDPPVVELSFSRIVEAVGNAENSTEPDEMGYLLVTWDRPLLKDADNFTCDAFALNSEKFPMSLNVSMEVTAIEPSMADLTNYIAVNDRMIEKLEKNLSDLNEEFEFNMHEIKHDIAKKTTSLAHKLNNIHIPKMEAGTSRCDERDIQFEKPYLIPPKVFIAFEAGGSYYNNYPAIFITQIKTTGFLFECKSDSSYYKKINWLALE